MRSKLFSFLLLFALVGLMWTSLTWNTKLYSANECLNEKRIIIDQQKEIREAKAEQLRLQAELKLQREKSNEDKILFFIPAKDVGNLAIGFIIGAILL